MGWWETVGGAVIGDPAADYVTEWRAPHGGACPLTRWGAIRGTMGKKRVDYRRVTTSVEGFVQQVAVQYLRHGYWFYMAGMIPASKDPTEVDTKLIDKYGIDVSRGERTRRKHAGLANVQYILNERLFLLMATHRDRRFFEQKAGQVRDARRVPIEFAGYSISFRNGHSSVRLDAESYRTLICELIEHATRLAALEHR